MELGLGMQLGEAGGFIPQYTTKHGVTYILLNSCCFFYTTVKILDGGNMMLKLDIGVYTCVR